jgi:hypothetical protein
VKAAMAAQGLTSKEQMFGMVAICNDGTEPAYGMVTICNEVAGGEDQEAAAAQSKQSPKVRFRFDTGATHHFSNTSVAVDDIEVDRSTVATASEGHHIQLTQQGTFTSEASTKSTSMEFDVKQSKEFSMNLFSGFKAVKDGCRVVLDINGSYILHTESGTRFPLEMTPSGWDLVLRNGSEAAAAALAFGALTDES